MQPTSVYRYEELAGFIMSLVDNGTLPPGSRAPSLRAICRQRRISLSAALQAYRLLEDRGVLEARPQSGYYVRSGHVSLKLPVMKLVLQDHRAGLPHRVGDRRAVYAEGPGAEIRSHAVRTRSPATRPRGVSIVGQL